MRLLVVEVLRLCVLHATGGAAGVAIICPLIKVANHQKGASMREGRIGT